MLKRKRIIVMAALMGVWIYANVHIDNFAKTQHPSIGKLIPDFEFFHSSEQRNSHIYDHINGSTFILFWSDGCYSCDDYLSYFATIKKIHSFAVIGVIYKDKEIKRYHRLASDAFDFIIFDQDRDIAIKLGVYGVPELFVVGSDKIVINKLYSLRETEEFVRSRFKDLSI